MKKYLLRILLTVLVVVGAHFLILFTVRAPLPAEYWVREFIVVKEHLGQEMKSPKIIFVGGSSTLYGIDAAKVQKELGIPALNFGVHAGMRLEDHLANARAVAGPGDIVVVGLEPAYYDYYTNAWDGWNVRNALAWAPEKIDNQPWWRRAQVFAQGSDPEISWDLLRAQLGRKTQSADVRRREETLAPKEKIVERFQSESGTGKGFAYDLAHLDANGDLLGIESAGLSRRVDVVSATRPAAVSAYASSQLGPFVAEMKKRGVRVFFEYTPYMVYEQPRYVWKSDEARFEEEIRLLGGEMLEDRSAYFYPPEDFYNTNLHLNARGRDIRTQALIKSLQTKLGLKPAP